MQRNIFRWVFPLLAAATLWARPDTLYAIGLSTRFVRVTLEDVAPGKRLRLSDAGKPRYSVKNLGNAPVLIEIRAIAPGPEDCKAGYEPVPDPSWIDIADSSFHLNPSEVRETDIFIAIPNKARYRGKKYHAKVTATIMDSPALVSAALTSHILIHVRKKSR